MYLKMKYNVLNFFVIFFLVLKINAQNTINAFSEKQVTIELLLVEYIHRDGFNWGIDILNAQKGKFSEGSFTPGNENVNFSSVYDITSSLTDKFKFNLQTLVNDNDASILQNPRVTVQNSKTGKINITEDKYIQLQTSSINGLTTQLQNIQVGVKLEILPEIKDNSLINLKVKGSLSEFQIINATGGDYSVETNLIDTDVTMRNDETLVIGGMIKKEDINSESGVLILRKIPLIGKLFTRIEKRVIQKEMVLYLTAYIHNDSDKIDYETKLFKKNLDEEVKSKYN